MKQIGTIVAAWLLSLALSSEVIAKPWQSERWDWESTSVVLESVPLTGVIFDAGLANLEKNGVVVNDLHLELVPGLPGESLELRWRLNVRGGPQDRHVVVYAVLRGETGTSIELPLLHRPHSASDATSPTWEQVIGADTATVREGRRSVSSLPLRTWATLMQEQPIELTVQLGVRPASDKLDELLDQVPRVANRLQEELASRDGSGQGLRRDMTMLQNELEDLRRRTAGTTPRASTRDSKRSGGQDDEPPAGAQTVNVVGAEGSTPQSSNDLEGTLSAFTSLYGEASLRPIIATVPDPIDSRFAREFDLLVAALREAAEDRGYTFDRRYLPWRFSPETFAFRREPGVLLFRGQTERPNERRHLAILLVGETPTTGIHVPAFRQALYIAEQRLGLSNEPGDDDLCTAFNNARRLLWLPTERQYLDVLGPTFSGSRDSLRSTLEQWQPGLETCIRMASGSATVKDNEAYFEASFGAVGLKNLVPAKRVIFRSMAVNDRVARRHMTRYLRDELGIRPEKVRLLTEASLYGTGFDSTVATAESQPPGAAEKPVCWDGESMDPVPDLSSMQFPMHIAQLRLDLAERDAASTPVEDQALRRDPYVGLGDAEIEETNVHRPMAPGLTSPSVNVVLAELIRDLVAMRIEAVGIVASDVKDKIFLAEQLRRHAPNVRLFTFEGDVLLAHPKAAENTRGMVVASSYSLRDPDPILDHATQEQTVRRRFANDWAQGLYLATRGMLSIPQALYVKENATCRPLWLSVVGNGSLLPLGRIKRTPRHPASEVVLSQPTKVDGLCWSDRISRAMRQHLLSFKTSLHDSSYRETCRATRWVVAMVGPRDPNFLGAWTPPRGWSLALVVVTTLSLVGIFLMFFCRKDLSFLPYEIVTSDLVAREGESGSTTKGEAISELRFWVGLGSSAMALFLLLLARPFFSTQWRGLDVFERFLVGSLLITALVTAVFLFGLAVHLAGLQVFLPSGHVTAFGKTLRPVHKRNLWRATIVVGLAVFALKLSVALFQGGDISPLFYVRTLGLGNGVSPLFPSIAFILVPLLWIAVRIRSYESIDRLRCQSAEVPAKLENPESSRDQNNDEPDSSRAEETPSKQVSVAMENLHRAVDPLPRPSWGKLAIPLLVVVVPVAYIGLYYDHTWSKTRVLRSLESVPFDQWASVFFLAALVLGSCSLQNAWLAWRGLKVVIQLGDGWRAAFQDHPDVRASAGGEQAPPVLDWTEVARVARRLRTRDPEREEMLDMARVALRSGDAPGQAHWLGTDHGDPGHEARLDGSGRGNCEEDSRPGEAPKQKQAARIAEAWLDFTVRLDHLTPRAQGLLLRSRGPVADVALVAEFYFVELANYIYTAVERIRRLLFFGVGVLLLLFTSVTIYPFQPQRLLMLYIGALLAGGALVSVWIMTKMEQQELVRWVEENDANWWGLDRSFLQGITFSGGLPIASLVAAYVPALRGALLEWIQPLLRMLG